MARLRTRRSGGRAGSGVPWRWLALDLRPLVSGGHSTHRRRTRARGRRLVRSWAREARRSSVGAKGGERTRGEGAMSWRAVLTRPRPSTLSGAACVTAARSVRVRYALPVLCCGGVARGGWEAAAAAARRAGVRAAFVHRRLPTLVRRLVHAADVGHAGEGDAAGGTHAACAPRNAACCFGVLPIAAATTVEFALPQLAPPRDGAAGA